jgi:hypothetical protein
MERFGRYVERWEAEAVARSFRTQGRKASVLKLHNYNYTVILKG